MEWGTDQELCITLGGHFWKRPTTVGENSVCERCGWLGSRNVPITMEDNGA